MRRVFLRILTCTLVTALGPVQAFAQQEAHPPPPPAEEPSASGSAEDEDWLKHRIDLIDELTFIGSADSVFNPDGSLYSAESWNNALRLNAEFGARLPADLSAKAQVSSALRSGSETTSTFAVRELYTTASLGNFELSIGRKILKWTNGYAFNPAGVLEPRRSPEDPQDRLRLLKGLEVAQLDYFAGDHVFTAVFSSDLLTNEEKVTRRYDLALRANVLVNSWNLDLAVVALVSNIKNRSTGALTFNYVFGDALELHGEISGTRGTSAEYPQSILSGEPRLYGRNYLERLKADEPGLFLRYVVGANYTLPWGTNLIGEFYHTDEGLSGEEWARFIEQANYSREQLLLGTHSPRINGLSLPEFNLLKGLERLAAQDIRQNYLFLRAHQSWMAERLSAQALALVNLGDRSSAFVGEVSYLFRRGATVYARASLLAGNDRSEFGNLGQRGALHTGVVFSF